MASISEAYDVALEHYDSGRVVQAERICRQILAEDEDYARAWDFLGVIELGRKNFAAATHLLSSGNSVGSELGTCAK